MAETAQTRAQMQAVDNREITKKRATVKKGLFKAELNQLLMKELAEDGYSGVEIRPLKKKTEVIIHATRTQSVVGEKGRRIRELTSLVQKRFGFPEGYVELYADKVANRGLCAVAQCESLRYKLIGGLAVRRAAYGVVRFIMESGAQGCEVVVSGKIRGQRAKAMKFCDGLMIHSGDPSNHYIQTAVRHVLLRQGVLGLKVKIMLPYSSDGAMGSTKVRQPDKVIVTEPKDDEKVAAPYSTNKDDLQKKAQIAHENALLGSGGGGYQTVPVPPPQMAPPTPQHQAPDVMAPPPQQQPADVMAPPPQQQPPAYMQQMDPMNLVNQNMQGPPPAMPPQMAAVPPPQQMQPPPQMPYAHPNMPPPQQPPHYHPPGPRPPYN